MQMDKKICNPNDTIWFRAYVTSDNSVTLSTNFYLELYDDGGQLVRRGIFPIYDGSVYGQINMSATPGFYWLRGYTAGANSEIIQPVTIMSEDAQIVIRKIKTKHKENRQRHEITVSRDSNNIGVVSFPNNSISNYSIAVVDVNDPGNAVSGAYGPSGPVTLDTSFIRFAASAERGTSKTKTEIVAYLRQEFILDGPWVLNVGTTNKIDLSGLYFFDTAYIEYRLNNSRKRINDDCLLVPDPQKFRQFSVPSAMMYSTDTLTTLPPQKNEADSFLNKVGYLESVTVKNRWVDRHRGLNNRYVLSSGFVPMEQYTYDLRDKSLLLRTGTVYDFVSRELPKDWAKKSILWKSCRDSIQYYVDERLVASEYVMMKRLDQFAYAKLFQDLHPPCPCICFWTRKDKDLAALSGEMKRVPVVGYTRPLDWTTPDRVTYHWNPDVEVNEYKFPIPAKKVKIIITGTTVDGELFSVERVID